MMEIGLTWRGPLSIPKLKDKMLNRPEFEEPHVYFYVLEYPSKMVVYVGRADDFLERMFGHYQGFLGLTYWLHNEDGEKVYEPTPDNRLKLLDCLDDALRITAAEVKRLSFFSALCPTKHLKTVEAALINWVMDRQDHGALECDNSRREYHGWDAEPIQITNQPDVSFPEASRYIEFVFGKGKILWGKQDG